MSDMMNIILKDFQQRRINRAQREANTYNNGQLKSSQKAYIQGNLQKVISNKTYGYQQNGLPEDTWFTGGRSKKNYKDIQEGKNPYQAKYFKPSIKSSFYVEPYVDKEGNKGGGFYSNKRRLENNEVLARRLYGNNVTPTTLARAGETKDRLNNYSIMRSYNANSKTFKDTLNTPKLDGLRVARNKGGGLNYLIGGTKDFLLDPVVDVLKGLDVIDSGAVNAFLGGLETLKDINDASARDMSWDDVRWGQIKKRWDESIDESNRTGWGKFAGDTLNEIQDETHRRMLEKAKREGNYDEVKSKIDKDLKHRDSLNMIAGLGFHIVSPIQTGGAISKVFKKVRRTGSTVGIISDPEIYETFSRLADRIQGTSKKSGLNMDLQTLAKNPKTQETAEFLGEVSGVKVKQSKKSANLYKFKDYDDTISAIERVRNDETLVSKILDNIDDENIEDDVFDYLGEKYPDMLERYLGGESKYVDELTEVDTTNSLNDLIDAHKNKQIDYVDENGNVVETLNKNSKSIEYNKWVYNIRNIAHKNQSRQSSLKLPERINTFNTYIDRYSRTIFNPQYISKTGITRYDDTIKELTKLKRANISATEKVRYLNEILFKGESVISPSISKQTVKNILDIFIDINKSAKGVVSGKPIEELSEQTLNYLKRVYKTKELPTEINSQTIFSDLKKMAENYSKSYVDKSYWDKLEYIDEVLGKNAVSKAFSRMKQIRSSGKVSPELTKELQDLQNLIDKSKNLKADIDNLDDFDEYLKTNNKDYYNKLIKKRKLREQELAKRNRRRVIDDDYEINNNISRSDEAFTARSEATKLYGSQGVLLDAEDYKRYIELKAKPIKNELDEARIRRVDKTLNEGAYNNNLPEWSELSEFELDELKEYEKIIKEKSPIFKNRNEKFLDEDYVSHPDVQKNIVNYLGLIRRELEALNSSDESFKLGYFSKPFDEAKQQYLKAINSFTSKFMVYEPPKYLDSYKLAKENLLTSVPDAKFVLNEKTQKGILTADSKIRYFDDNMEYYNTIIDAIEESVKNGGKIDEAVLSQLRELTDYTNIDKARKSINVNDMILDDYKPIKYSKDMSSEDIIQGAQHNVDRLFNLIVHEIKDFDGTNPKGYMRHNPNYYIDVINDFVDELYRYDKSYVGFNPYPYRFDKGLELIYNTSPSNINVSEYKDIFPEDVYSEWYNRSVRYGHHHQLKNNYSKVVNLVSDLLKRPGFELSDDLKNLQKNIKDYSLIKDDTSFINKIEDRVYEAEKVVDNLQQSLFKNNGIYAPKFKPKNGETIDDVIKYNKRHLFNLMQHEVGAFKRTGELSEPYRDAYRILKERYMKALEYNGYDIDQVRKYSDDLLKKETGYDYYGRGTSKKLNEDPLSKLKKQIQDGESVQIDSPIATDEKPKLDMNLQLLAKKSNSKTPYTEVVTNFLHEKLGKTLGSIGVSVKNFVQKMFNTLKNIFKKSDEDMFKDIAKNIDDNPIIIDEIEKSIKRSYSKPEAKLLKDDELVDFLVKHLDYGDYFIRKGYKKDFLEPLLKPSKKRKLYNDEKSLEKHLRLKIDTYLSMGYKPAKFFPGYEDAGKAPSKYFPGFNDRGDISKIPSYLINKSDENTNYLKDVLLYDFLKKNNPEYISKLPMPGVNSKFSKDELYNLYNKKQKNIIKNSYISESRLTKKLEDKKYYRDIVNDLKNKHNVDYSDIDFKKDDFAIKAELKQRLGKEHDSIADNMLKQNEEYRQVLKTGIKDEDGVIDKMFDEIAHNIQRKLSYYKTFGTSRGKTMFDLNYDDFFNREYNRFSYYINNLIDESTSYSKPKKNYEKPTLRRTPMPLKYGNKPTSGSNPYVLDMLKNNDEFKSISDVKQQVKESISKPKKEFVEPAVDIKQQVKESISKPKKEFVEPAVDIKQQVKESISKPKKIKEKIGQVKTLKGRELYKYSFDVQTQNLSKTSINDLKIMCKKLGVKGYSNKSKRELIDMIDDIRQKEIWKGNIPINPVTKSTKISYTDAGKVMEHVKSLNLPKDEHHDLFNSKTIDEFNEKLSKYTEKYKNAKKNIEETPVTKLDDKLKGEKTSDNVVEETLRRIWSLKLPKDELDDLHNSHTMDELNKKLDMYEKKYNNLRKNTEETSITKLDDKLKGEETLKQENIEKTPVTKPTKTPYNDSEEIFKHIKMLNLSEEEYYGLADIKTIDGFNEQLEKYTNRYIDSLNLSKKERYDLDNSKTAKEFNEKLSKYTEKYKNAKKNIEETPITKLDDKLKGEETLKQENIEEIDIPKHPLDDFDPEAELEQLYAKRSEIASRMRDTHKKVDGKDIIEHPKLTKKQIKENVRAYEWISKQIEELEDVINKDAPFSEHTKLKEGYRHIDREYNVPDIDPYSYRFNNNDNKLFDDALEIIKKRDKTPVDYDYYDSRGVKYVPENYIDPDNPNILYVHDKFGRRKPIYKSEGTTPEEIMIDKYNKLYPDKPYREQLIETGKENLLRDKSVDKKLPWEVEKTFDNRDKNVIIDTITGEVRPTQEALKLNAVKKGRLKDFEKGKDITTPADYWIYDYNKANAFVDYIKNEGNLTQAEFRQLLDNFRITVDEEGFKKGTTFNNFKEARRRLKYIQDEHPQVIYMSDREYANFVKDKYGITIDKNAFRTEEEAQDRMLYFVTKLQDKGLIEFDSNGEVVLAPFVDEFINSSSFKQHPLYNKFEPSPHSEKAKYHEYIGGINKIKEKYKGNKNYDEYYEAVEKYKRKYSGIEDEVKETPITKLDDKLKGEETPYNDYDDIDKLYDMLQRSKDPEEQRRILEKIDELESADEVNIPHVDDTSNIDDVPDIDDTVNTDTSTNINKNKDDILSRLSSKFRGGVDSAFDFINPPVDGKSWYENNAVFDVYKRWLNTYKRGVTLYNPGWHLANFMQNKAQSYYGLGVDAFKRQKKANQMLDAIQGKSVNLPDIKTKDGKTISAKDVMDYAIDNEIIDGLYKDIESAPKTIFPNLDKRIDDTKLMQFLARNEQTARLHHFITQIENGMSFEDAHKSVNKYLFDYNKKGEADKFMENFIDPFWIFHKNSARLAGEASLRNPSRMGNVMRMERAMQNGINEEERNHNVSETNYQFPYGSYTDTENGDRYDMMYKQNMFITPTNVFPGDFASIEGKMNPLLKLAIQQYRGKGNWNTDVVDGEPGFDEISRDEKKREVVTNLNPVLNNFLTNLNKSKTYEEREQSQETIDKQKMMLWLNYITGGKFNYQRNLDWM